VALMTSLEVGAAAATAAPVEWIRDGKPVAKLYYAPLAQEADSRVFDPKVNVPRRSPPSRRRSRTPSAWPT
jgi:hypothetical protein